MSNKRLLKKLAKIFSWRHAITSYDLSLYDRYPSKPKKILLSGSSGLIGSSMLAFLRAGGHEVIRLVREKPSPDAIVWDPRYEKTNKQAFEGFDAVLHLAGENIAERWTEKKKNSIFLSRARDTWLLSEILSRLQNPPKVLICASAIGFYGDRKEELLTEDSRKGEGFLSDVCAKWEAATLVLENRGIRVVQTRFGAVLSPAGGILKKMLPAFQMNLGGKLGSGKQFISWIAIDDLIGALYHILMKEDLKGVFNCTSPHPVMQKDFAKTLAKVLHRKAFISMPAFLLRSIFGEMADEMLLASQNVIPKKLVESGYTFSFPELEKALRFWY